MGSRISGLCGSGGADAPPIEDVKPKISVKALRDAARAIDEARLKLTADQLGAELWVCIDRLVGAVRARGFQPSGSREQLINDCRDIMRLSCGLVLVGGERRPRGVRTAAIEIATLALSMLETVGAYVVRDRELLATALSAASKADAADSERARGPVLVFYPEPSQSKSPGHIASGDGRSPSFLALDGGREAFQSVDL